MAKTRYAIVKVNNHCPSRFVDNVRNEYVCRTKQTRGGYILNCIGCRYGDTKEQMIKKVAQVIKRELKGDCVAGLKDTTFVMKWCVVENLAKKIIEFLGVVE